VVRLIDGGSAGGIVSFHWSCGLNFALGGLETDRGRKFQTKIRAILFYNVCPELHEAALTLII